MKDHFVYELKTPLDIDYKGKVVNASSLIVRAPRPKDMTDSIGIEAIYSNAMLSVSSFYNKNDDNIPVQNKNEKDTDKETSEDDKIDTMLLMLWGGIDNKKIHTVFFHLKKLLTEQGSVKNPQCTLGDTALTSHLFDQISVEDAKQILGRYIYHFLSKN